MLIVCFVDAGRETTGRETPAGVRAAAMSSLRWQVCWLGSMAASFSGFSKQPHNNHPRHHQLRRDKGDKAPGDEGMADKKFV